MRIINFKKSFLIYFSIIILSSCSVIKTVDFGDISNVEFRGMVDNKISIELQVPVNNKNNYKIKITSMDLDVTVNGTYLGKMKISSNIIIPAMSNGMQIFPVEIHVKNVLGSMSSLYKMRKMKNMEMEIDGTIKVKALLRSRIIKVSEKQNVSI